MYNFETDLVAALQEALRESNVPQFSQLNVGFEFAFHGGRTDVVAEANEGVVIAFEAKLIKWRPALYQAYRNTSFAHYSYVAVPSNTARNALKRAHEFERRGIGLCAIESSILKVVIPARRNEPLLPWLTDIALEYITGSLCLDSLQSRSGSLDQLAFQTLPLLHQELSKKPTEH